MFFHRIFEEIQKIEDNEFHYQEQVLEVKFFLNIVCDQVETDVDIVPLFGSVPGVLILPLSVMWVSRWPWGYLKINSCVFEHLYWVTERQLGRLTQVICCVAVIHLCSHFHLWIFLIPLINIHGELIFWEFKYCEYILQGNVKWLLFVVLEIVCFVLSG